MRRLLAAAALLTLPLGTAHADDAPHLYYLGPEIGVVPIVQTPVGPVIAIPGQNAIQVVPGFPCPCGIFANNAIPSQFVPYTPVGQPPALPPNLWHGTGTPAAPTVWGPNGAPGSNGAPASAPDPKPAEPAQTGGGSDSPHSR